MRAFSWAVPCLLISLSRTCWAQDQCFFPNGSPAKGDFPCDPGARDSPCCSGTRGSACLSNKLCRGPDGNTIRGSCTDTNWISSECPAFCLSANTGGTDLISCSNVTRTDTSYCCDHQAFCCNDGVGRFDVLPSKPQVWATWDAVSSQFVVQKMQSSTAEPTASPSISAPAGTAGLQPGQNTTATTAAIAPTDGTTTSSTAPPANPPSQTPSPGLSTAAQAGIGAGVTVVALLGLAVVYLLWKLRKNKRRLEMTQKAHSSQQPPQPQGMMEVDHGTGWHPSQGYLHGYPEYAKPMSMHHQDSDGYSNQRGYGMQVELPTTQETDRYGHAPQRHTVRAELPGSR